MTALIAANPNIVLILADDLGAHDLGCTGSTFHETPNLDRLARDGIRFTQAYSACTVCSPTRAGLMTGKHPARLKITDWIAGHDAPKAKLRPPEWTKQLPLGELTLAEHLKGAGYATAHIGKWHLGGEGFGPTHQGFDINLGGDHRGQPPSYFAPYGLPKLTDGPKGEYLTDREGFEAAKFIRERHQAPFFLNVALHSVHTPLQAKPELVRKYESKLSKSSGSQQNPTYAAMLESLDDAVGRILKALDDAGVAQRTLVIFSSDNGGLVLGKNPPTSNLPLRSGKGSPYEGGIRVPLLIRLPGVTQPGGSRSQPVITMDLPATILDLTGVGTTNAAPDGKTLRGLLSDTSAILSRDFLCWHYPHYHPGGATPYAAIRMGDWKLIQYYEDGRHELFDLKNDASESKNLADSNPEKLNELARKLFEWQGTVGAQWPMYNPAYEPKSVPQLADNSVLLHSRQAAIHGTALRYEPMPFKNTLGWWGRAEDWVDWKFEIHRPGTFDIEILQGCGTGHGGSDVIVDVAGTRIPFVVEETGHFQNFVPRRIGRVTLASAGKYTLAIQPQRKPGGAVMDVRQVRLVPPATSAEPSAGVRPVVSAKRVVFLGDSITYAGEWVEFVETWLRLQYPDTAVEFINLGLPSETLSGLSEPGHAGGSFPRPDVHERLSRVLEKAKPDLIVACYGMNDGIYHPLSEERLQKFQSGVRRLRERAGQIGVQVLHVTPPVFDPLPLKGRTLPAGLSEYRTPYVGYNEVLDKFSEWLVSQRAQGWNVIDSHSPMNRFLVEYRQKDSNFLLAGDGVHANTQGHWLIAREVLRFWGAPHAVLDSESPAGLVQSDPRAAAVLKLVQQRQRLLKDSWLTHVGHVRPGMGKGKPIVDAQREADEITAKLHTAIGSSTSQKTQPATGGLSKPTFPGKISEWNGFQRFDFEVAGRPSMVITPTVEAPGRPWVWHGEFFGHKPAPDLALLKRGFHVVYLSVPDMLGSPKAVGYWNEFYSELIARYGFSSRAALVGLSRGGLYCYNWAIANPTKVACIYADAPVCDFKSWPGGKGKGPGSPRDWKLVLENFGFRNDGEALAYPGNPVDNLEPLARAKVPLLHVFGDADEVVPWDENTGLVDERYRKLGGRITLIRKPGVKHHPHGLEDPTPIIEFLWENATSPEARTWWQQRP